MACPYCGNHDESRFTDPQSLLCADNAREMAKLGIVVPTIQMCKCCDATLRPSAFIPGTHEHEAARKAVMH